MNSRNERNRLAIGSLGISVLCTFAFVGCGPTEPAGVVVGAVTLKGKPISDATVVLYEPQIGRGVTCAIDETGAFRTPEPIPPGTYLVQIGPSEDLPSVQPGEDRMPPAPVPGHPIPRAYLAYSTTPLKVNVTEGEIRYDIAIP